PATQNISEPRNIIRDDSGGTTTPSPMASGESGNRFRVGTRMISLTSATSAAIAIDQTIEVVSSTCPEPPPKIVVTRSDTPFHCTAPGKANLSLTIVSCTLTAPPGT